MLVLLGVLVAIASMGIGTIASRTAGAAPPAPVAGPHPAPVVAGGEQPGEPSDAPGALYVNLYDGLISGTIAPATDYAATLVREGAVRASATGRSDATGRYAQTLQYDLGSGPGIHNGDTVRLTVGSRVYEQLVTLTGYLDESTGLLTGTVAPRATLAVRLYTHGDLATQVWSGTVTADAGGSYRLDFAALHTPPKAPGRPSWRGYIASVQSTTTPGQTLFRLIQTPNTTLISTRNMAAGGFFIPNDHVTYELLRAGRVVATTTATADVDGMPQAFFDVDVVDGDVLRTRYHDASDRNRQQVLSPWLLSAAVELSTGVLSGTTEARAPVVAEYFGENGVQVVHGIADSNGAYAIDLRAAGVDLVGNRMLVVFRIADPGFTGVGAQQLELRTPAVGLNDLTMQLSGYGTPAVLPVTARVLRGDVTLQTLTGTSGRDGGFAGLQLGEVVPGDRIEVTTGTQRLPTFVLGSGPLTVTRQPSGGGLQGTGQSGRAIRVTVATVDGGSCTADAVVAVDGTWSAQPSCALAGNDDVEVRETVGPSEGATAGSTRFHFENLAAPELSLQSPTAGAVVTGTLTVRGRAVDGPTGAPSPEVWLDVDGTWLPAQVAANGDFEVPLQLAAGSHHITAYAFAAGGALDPRGAPVYAVSPVRQVTA